MGLGPVSYNVICKKMKIKNRKRIVALSIFVVLLFSITSLITYYDKHRQLVEEYIYKNEEIKNKYGKINSLKLLKITKVGLDTKIYKYKKYLYKIKGEKKSSVTAIKLTPSPSKEYHIEIVN